MSIPNPPQNQWPPQQAYPQAEAPWPPPPGANDAAWPPPAYGTPPPQFFAIPFRNLTGSKVIGNVSDYRVGGITFTDQGLFIDGQAALPLELRNLYSVFFLLLGIGVVIALLILDSCFLKRKQLMVPWADVKSIVYTKKRDRAGIAFDAPSFYGKQPIKTFSITFKLRPEYAEGFIETANHCLPGKVEEGKLRSSTPVIIWAFLLLILIFFIAIGILASTSGK